MAARENISIIAYVEQSENGNKTASSEQCITEVVPSQVTIAIYISALLVSLIGNSLLITAFVGMKDNGLLLIANMAASDLLVAIFLIPRLITRQVIGSNAFLVHGSGGMLLCKMCTFLSDISLSVSTLSLVLIAVERLTAVMYPILYRKTSTRKRRLLVASTWIMAAAFHSPYFYTMRLVSSVDNGHDIKICQPSWEPGLDNKSVQRGYNIFLFSTVLILPFLIISVLYVIVIVHLRKNTTVICRSDRGTRRSREYSRNLQKMATATATALLICWTPYTVTHFLELFPPRLVPKCNKILSVIYYISLLLASCYCAVNPWICFLFVPKFSRALRMIRKGKFQQPTRASRSTCNNCQIELE